jgi:ribosome-associated translation inhibitor RaiA
MKIQVNTDDNIQGREDVAESVSATVENALRRFKDQITRVEVHLGDENAGKSGQRDKRCMVEARLEGRQPAAATALAPTTAQAVQAASEKLARMLETQLGRLATAHRSAAPPTPDVG